MWEPDNALLIAAAHISEIPGIPGAHLAVSATRDDRSLEKLLHPEELRQARLMNAVRRSAFEYGRATLRAAIAATDVRAAGEAVLQTSRGAPILPEGIAGSLSHKGFRTVAVAASTKARAANLSGEGRTGGDHAVAEGEARSAGIPGAVPHPVRGYRVDVAEEARIATVGIDVEFRATQRRPHTGLARRILTAREISTLPDTGESRNEDILLRFALKEAVYKAIHPYVLRYVGFKEVELHVPGEHTLTADSEVGTVEVSLLLPELRERRLTISARWWKEDEYITALAVTHAGQGVREP